MMAKEYIDRIDFIYLFYLSFYVKRYFQWQFSVDNNNPVHYGGTDEWYYYFINSYLLDFTNIIAGLGVIHGISTKNTFATTYFAFKFTLSNIRVDTTRALLTSGEFDYVRQINYGYLILCI